MKLTRVFCIIAASWLGWIGSSHGGTVDRVIAKVNEDILTESDVAEIAAERNRRSGADAKAFTTETVGAVIDRTLLLQEAKKQKLGVPDDELQEEVEKMVAEIREQYPSENAFLEELANNGMSLEKLKNDLLKKARNDYKLYQAVSSRYSISDAEAARFEQDAQAEGKPIAQYKLRRLALKIDEEGVALTKERMQTVLAKMRAQNVGFEDGVRKYSEAPGAKEDGGAMEYMTLDKLAPELRNALQKLDRGQATKPIQTGEFLSVFYVEDRRGARSVLSKKRFEAERVKLLEELRRKVHIQVYDPRLLEQLPSYYRSRVENPNAIGDTGGQRQSREIYSASQDEKSAIEPASIPQETPASRKGLRSLFQRKQND